MFCFLFSGTQINESKGTYNFSLPFLLCVLFFFSSLLILRMLYSKRLQVELASQRNQTKNLTSIPLFSRITGLSEPR